jgi:hypothetical protein
MDSIIAVLLDLKLEVILPIASADSEALRFRPLGRSDRSLKISLMT